MLNQVVLVGRIIKEIEIKDEEKKIGTITIATPRSFKNENGEYDTDFINCIVSGGISENVKEYCKVGDLVGIKGRIQTEKVETENDGVIDSIKIVAEKLTFLSSKKEEE